MAVAAILFLMDSSQKLIRSSEIPREQSYQIWMQSKQQFISYRTHKLFRRPSFFQMAAAAILFLMDSSQNLSDHLKYLDNNHAKFECNPTNCA